MPSILTKEDVDRVAELARLELTESEREMFIRQLTDILVYAQQVCELDTTGVVPTTHVLTNQGTLRPDETRPSLSRKDALASAPDPDTEKGFFKVPKVIE
ncbi:MAG: Asp-tRNA(Asn)/Glu-tRNA(Gln) amidotransferase GatCAB subunit C [Woeseiaceae bacterium]|jgi:aspartyl-tRNA(Asn)/glutamyl-tRNA(Gln) amidotransferase subunit C|nr:Asp-tRNA(Asn)/Glu-tRNA(Gln) amidotransferase GatCAB subunit C [Woeseiaceae bacterium]|tara:strand:- start:293 stop:592 length:300 start_codon:yes stop_codon:yes gene_type:complete